MNLYGFLANDPLNSIDPLGRAEDDGEVPVPGDDLSVYAIVSVKYSRIEISSGNALQGALEGIVLGPFAAMTSIGEIDPWQSLSSGGSGLVEYDACKSLIVLVEVLPTSSISWESGSLADGSAAKWPVPRVYPYVSSMSDPGIRSRGGYSVINREGRVGSVAPGMGIGGPGLAYSANRLWEPMGAGSALSAWNPFTDAGGSAIDWISMTDPTSIGLNANNPISYLEIVPMKTGWWIFGMKLSTYNLWVEMMWVPPVSSDESEKLQDIFRGTINVE